jgi:hypothetical protein
MATGTMEGLGEQLFALPNHPQGPPEAAFAWKWWCGCPKFIRLEISGVAPSCGELIAINRRLRFRPRCLAAPVLLRGAAARLPPD